MSTSPLRRLTVALVPALLGAALTWHLAAPADDEPIAFEPIAFESGRYDVDTVHSSVRFGILHAGVANFYGRFNEMDGRYVLDADDPTQCEITFLVEADSVDTNHPDRDAHLRSDDFFASDRYKRMTFESTSCERTGPNTFRLTGDLTLRDTTEEVTVDATLIGAGKTQFADYRTGLEARFTLDRTDFGMDKYRAGLGDEISVFVSLEGSLRD